MFRRSFSSTVSNAHIMQAGTSGNIYDLYAGSGLYESSRGTPTILTEVFCALPRTLQVKAGILT
jgi:hypothetical protein